MRPVAAVLLLLLASSLPAQTVTLPLTDYDKLRTPSADNITVVDTLRLSGSFRNRDLAVTFIGKSVGARSATAVLQAGGGLAVWGCSGNALISRDDASFRITPLAPSFEAKCHISAAGSDRLELTTTRDVLAVESNVTDGELAAASGANVYSLVRQSGSAENLAPTATGHYLITLLPDETRFQYRIDVHNPNRGRRPFEVRLQSGEHLQQVDADVSYEMIDGLYRFDLPPGDRTLVLSGQLASDHFTPPVDASLQYLAIENHPIIRPKITGAVKRISVGETGVPIAFRGPQAFLLGKGESVHWEKTKLEALHTVSYALNGVHHTFFIPAEGAILGESIFGIDNQGASDIKLPLHPEPTFVSVQNEPLLMTKDTDGTLTVPLSAGKQDVLVQHRQTLRRFFGFGIGDLSVPQIGVPATSLFVAINYPRQWTPLVETFSTRWRFWSPDGISVVIAIVVFAWCERLLAWLLIANKRRRITIAALLAISCAAFAPVFIVTMIACALLTIGWLAQALKREKWTPMKALLATCVTIAAVGVFLYDLSTQTRLDRMMTVTGSGGLASVSEPFSLSGEAKQYEDEASAQTNAMQLNYSSSRADAAKKTAQVYQGLPARFDMPAGSHHSYFGQEMLSADRPHHIRVVLISSSLIFAIEALLLAIALVALWRARKELASGFAARFPPRAIAGELADVPAGA